MGSRRFEITETAGSVKGFYVVVDRETGVNYLVAKFGTGGGSSKASRASQRSR